MRLKSLRPWRAPLSSDSLAGTASGSDVECVGMFQRIQCVQVPTGASGSSAMSASERALAGMSVQFSAGERFSPLQVYLRGISPPLGKAVLFSAKDMVRVSFQFSMLACYAEMALQAGISDSFPPICSGVITCTAD